MTQPAAVLRRRPKLLASAAPDRRPLKVVQPAPRFTVQVESFIDIAHELPPLFVRFGKELAKAPVEPDWQSFFNMTLAGVLRTTTARYDGALVGFALNIVGPHMFHKGTCFGMTTAVWLDRAYRNAWNGFKFLRHNRDNLREWGVKRACIMRDTVKSDARLDKVYRRLGYEPDELNYTAVF